MAIYINKMELPITPEDALNIIQSHTARMGVFIDLDRAYEVVGILKMENHALTKKMRSICGNPSFNPNDKNGVLETIVSLGIPRRELLLKGDTSTSAKVLKPIIEAGEYDAEVLEFLSSMVKYSSNKSIIGWISKSLITLPRCKALSFNNHRMALARPTYSLLSTWRIQAADPNIQGLARDFGDIITYPKGYILQRTDSAQIEPRINFSYFIRDDLIVNLITYYNDAYFGILHYCLLSDEEDAAYRADFEKNFVPIEITSDIKDKRQTLKTLTNAGSYGSHNLGNVDLALHAKYDRRIVKHPARLALERKAADQVRRGDTTFYGAFGTPVTPTSTQKYQEGDSSWNEHVIRCAINNPVQTTASELMIHSVAAASKRLENAKESAICYYKHDEGAFLVSEDDAAKDPTLVDDLSDITAYNVEGWVPIPADPLIGMKAPTLPSYL